MIKEDITQEFRLTKNKRNKRNKYLFYLTLIKLSFLKILFPGGGRGQFDPSPLTLHIQEELI